MSADIESADAAGTFAGAVAAVGQPGDDGQDDQDFHGVSFEFLISRWVKADRGAEILAWLSRWIRDLVIVITGGDHEHLLQLDQLAQLRRYARQADADSLLDLMNDIERTEQQATRHLNLHMALENILLRLREALGLARAAALV